MSKLVRLRVISENLITDQRLADTEKWLDRWINRLSKVAIVLGVLLILFMMGRLYFVQP